LDGTDRPGEKGDRSCECCGYTRSGFHGESLESSGVDAYDTDGFGFWFDFLRAR
jgi:hypothetical protein